MKIKVKEFSIDEVSKLPKERKFIPKKPNILFRTLLKAVSLPDIKATGFTYESEGMEKLGKDEPCLILMNHSSFIDLKIASYILYPRAFNIVCTSDGFVGKKGLMRNLGCIPTNKFVADIKLVKDMIFALKKLKSSVLMYPEASYTFDGTATPLPESLGKCIKLLGVPVIMIRTYGAFLRDPLYNNLRLRKVKVSAKMKYLLSPDSIKSMEASEINEILKEEFSFDNFKIQQEEKISVNEEFRADDLNRVLYKCPHCGKEGMMQGKGIYISCKACGEKYELTEYGFLKNTRGETKFSHIPDWYKWERDTLREQIEKEGYHSEYEVDVYVLRDMQSIYKVGEGILSHDMKGFCLDACGGKIKFDRSSLSMYSVYSDYYWYEIGDMICVGDNDILYYCFPKNAKDVAAKERMATEEIYKYLKKK